MMWLPPELSNNIAEPEIEFMVVIADVNSSIVDDQTSSSNFTATLQFNTTYYISVYASRCNGTLISEPLNASITIEKGTKI